MRSLLIVLTLALGMIMPHNGGAWAQRNTSAELTLPTGFRYPNGITRASDGTLYVGSVTSGRVLHQRPGGGWEVFFPGSDRVYAGTALRLDEPRSLLWGASPDFLPGARARPHHVFALDSRTGVVRRVLTLPDGGFGNDLALAPDGTLFVTDSKNGRILRLRSGAERLEMVIEHPDLGPVGGVGVGGIARAADGRLIVGNFGSGRFYVLDGIDAGTPRLRPLALPRLLENPDGLAFAPDGSLLVLEGAVRSGDGKLLSVADPFTAGERPFLVVRAGLPSPVNLTVAPDGRAFVTLSRIRHRLLPGRENDVPEHFSVLVTETGAALPGITADRIVALIDADHGADTYADGRLPLDMERRDAVLVLDPGRPPRTLAASNSVTSPPEALAVSPDGRVAFVVERLQPRAQGQTRAAELAPGRRLTALDLDAEPDGALLAHLDLPFRPESARLAPNGRHVAVAGNEAGRPVLAVVPFDGASFGAPTFHRPALTGSATASFADWRPDGRVLSLHLHDRDEVRFLRWDGTRLDPWGAPVRTGADPFTGRWSPEGRHYFALEWGRNLAATSLAERLPSRPSSVGVIELYEGGAHRRVAGAETDRSSEGIDVSPDGRWIVTVNMRETALPPGSPRHTPEATLTLLAFDPAEGEVRKVGDWPFKGVLPEGVAFSPDGRRVYVTVYAERDTPGGRIDIWRLVTELLPTLVAEAQIPVPQGIHYVEVARRLQELGCDPSSLGRQHRDGATNMNGEVVRSRKEWIE